MDALSGFTAALPIVFAALFGLIFGSFVGALSYRLPRGLSVVRGRSMCPACGVTLTARDLVPIVSWLASGGACRYCGSGISKRYPIIEFVTAFLFATAVTIVHEPRQLALVLTATPVIVALAVIDLEFRRLPNSLLVLLLVVSIANRYFLDSDFRAAAISALAVLVASWLIDAAARRFAGQSLGTGDAKLMAIVAIALSPKGLLVTIIAGGVIGALAALSPWPKRPATADVTLGPPILAVFWLWVVIA